MSPYMVENDDNSDDDDEIDNTPLHEFNFDNYDFESNQVSTLKAGNMNGVSPEHLSKIWRIDHQTAKRTIARTEIRNLSRQYPTNDRMLRYRRINTHFFMDTFFATKKANKTHGNTCCQLFVSDKSFVYVVPMRTRQDVPKAVRAFAKAIGAPVFTARFSRGS